MSIFKSKTLALVSGRKDSKSYKKESISSRPGENSPPPSYSEDAVADYDMTASIRKLHLSPNLSTNSTTVPTNDECIAHLKLLACFANLREEVSETDGLFGLRDGQSQGEESLSTSIPPHPKTQSLPTIARIREKRWAIYVTRAVERFQKWWETLLPGRGEQLRLQMRVCLTPGGLEKLMEGEPPLRWREDMLPPIDILMVLHSFMLNPRDFLEDCLRFDMVPLWNSGFPWKLVNSSLDSRSFDYNPTEDAVARFETKTKLSWDNLRDRPTKIITCTQCQTKIDHPYTDADFDDDPNRTAQNGKGYADKFFEVKCSNCPMVINHESLCLVKFYNDLQALLNASVPMPGTILSLDGLPTSAVTANEQKHELFFPNRLILAGLHETLMPLCQPGSKLFGLAKVDDIRNAISEGLKDRSLVSKANGKNFSNTLKRSEKVSIRRLMSHYWDNASSFSLDLTGAVLRQGIFVDKMKAIDWIHSPALENTMSRLVQKYVTFFKIMELNKGHVAVPTLDVDLAWHTHQLSPLSYFHYSLAHANGQFVDHDDKIDENALTRAFEWTSKQYQKVTNGQVYSECTCWYCEAIRESHNNDTVFASTKSSGNRSSLALHDRKDISADPNKNPHISSHNAVHTQSLAGPRIARMQLYKLQADYDRAAKRARKAGKSPPDRDAYYTSYVWGYPMYTPYMGYYPFYVDPCITGSMYVSNPACMTTMPGAVGNCVSGACGGTVGQGACASLGGGCAGGAAGGCGGGGGGCGGGGGGGGGGGCGGGGG